MASGGMRINLPNLVLEMREILVRAAGEREMAPKCGSLPRDAGDLVGLCRFFNLALIMIDVMEKCTIFSITCKLDNLCHYILDWSRLWVSSPFSLFVSRSGFYHGFYR